MNQYLWDPTLGAYAVSDTMPGTVAQDGNSLAILYGIAPKSAVPAILAAMVISFMIFVKTLPFFASVMAFLCLIPAQ